MAGLVLVSGPSIEPVTRDEAKSQLRLDIDTDDTLVDSLILAARQWAEKYTARVFIQRTFKQYLDSFYQLEAPLWEGVRTGPYITHYANYIEIEPAPVSAITAIKYFDDSDNETTWATSNYYADTISEPARIILRDGGAYPTDLRSFNALEISLTAGYGTATTDVPEAIRVAILQYITFLYEHRGDFERFPPPKPPIAIQNLLDPYRILRFSNHSYNKMFKSGIG